MDLLPHLTRYSKNAQAPVQGCVIWLHGLGASGHDFEPLVPHLGLDFANIRFIFPHAPARPVTLNMGMVMPSWYDILSIAEIREVNQEQVQSSVQNLRDFIENEHQAGLPYDKIILAGFSQGGAITYETALNFEHQLGGIMALSTYLFDPNQVPPADQSPNQDTALLIHHGRFDPVVAPPLAERSYEALKQAGYTPQWKSYPMEHGVCPEQIQDIAQWLQNCFKELR